MNKGDRITRNSLWNLMRGIVLYISYFWGVMGLLWADNANLLVGWILLPLLGVPPLIGMIKLEQLVVNLMVQRFFEKQIEIRGSDLFIVQIIPSTFMVFGRLFPSGQIRPEVGLGLWVVFLTGVLLWGWEERKEWEDMLWRSQRSSIERASRKRRIKALLIDIVMIGTPVVGASFFLVWHFEPVFYQMRDIKLWMLLGIFVLLFLTKDAMFLRSPGKASFSMYVGKKHEPKRCAEISSLVLRNVVLLMLLPLEVFFFFFREDRLGDRLTETSVYRISSF